MNVVDVHATPIVVPLRRAYHGSNYVVSTRVALLVTVDTDDGIRGEAIVGDERVRYMDVVRIVEGPIRSAIVGASLHRLGRLWATMFAVTHHERDKHLALRAVAAVDVALWDAIGKCHRQPVTALLGGHHDGLPVVAFHYGPVEQTIDQLVQEVGALLDEGYAGIKLKVGRRNVADDVARVHALREGLGSTFLLGCDANRAWSFDEALAFARGAEPVGIDWLEEPVHWNSATEDLRRLRERTKIPLAAGQSEATAEMSLRLVRAGAVDLLNSDVALIGGVTAWRSMAAGVRFDGIGLLHHEETHLAAHLLTAVEHGRYVEVHADVDRDPIWHDLLTTKPTIADGLMTPPPGPGWGLELDRDFVDRYAVHEHRRPNT